MRHHRADDVLSPLPDTFSLLTWNVHKEMGRSAFNETLAMLLEEKKPELVLLQEAVLDRHTQPLLPGYNFSAAINIDLRRKQYGVLTAAKCPIVETVGLKTSRREMHIATRKSLLMTTHPLNSGAELTAVNLHAINFVSAAVFVEEIERLIETLRLRTGPMIVAGDFNTWSRKRMEYMKNFARFINLEPAVLADEHHIKHRFSKPLDHLYFRELECIGAGAIDTGRVSDHNPIVATFRHAPTP
jgi:endonuclease/exonuclease/phosphatase (EEP) superfamily protein YafD